VNFNVKCRCERRLRYSCHSVQVLLWNHLFRKTGTSQCTYKCFSYSAVRIIYVDYI